MTSGWPEKHRVLATVGLYGVAALIAAISGLITVVNNIVGQVLSARRARNQADATHEVRTTVAEVKTTVAEVKKAVEEQTTNPSQDQP